MNIHNIHTLQGQQNMIHSSSEVNVATSNGILSMVTPSNSGTLSGKPETSLGESHKVTTLINNLQKDLESDLNVVLDPPFFPIASYQRLDLIEKIRGLGEEIQRSSLDEGLKSTISGNFLKDSATDEEISAAVGKLFAIRDHLTEGVQASPEDINPGSILSIEV
jgi:hypothetical protein